MLGKFRKLGWSINSDSQTGPVREHNEDCIASREDRKRSYGIVCDGVGGNNAGEVAAQHACAFLAAQLDDINVVDETTLRLVLQRAHFLLCDQGEADAALRCMATTVVLAVQCGASAWLAWAGDSRAYSLSGGNLQKLTDDHSFIAEKIAQGVLSSEEANAHPMASMITSALGGSRGGLRHRGVKQIRLRRGDYLCLMTDGVYGVLSNDELQAAVRHGAEALTKQAIDNGSTDNASAVVISMI